MKKTKPHSEALAWIETALKEAKSPLDRKLLELFLGFTAVHLDIPAETGLQVSAKELEEIRMVSTLVYPLPQKTPTFRWGMNLGGG